MSDGLRDKAVRGVAWKGFERIANQGMRFVFTVVLARLLSPAEFGLIGMLAIFIALGKTIFQSGFGMALIQKKEASSDDFNTVWIVNLVVSVVVYIILYTLAPAIAAFYQEPQLTDLLRILSVGLLFNAVGYIHGIILTKHINFKALAKVNLAATLLSGTTGIALAFKGAGVYSLAAQAITMNMFIALFVMLATPWRPHWTFSFNSLKSLWSYGSRLLMANFLSTFSGNLYLIAIGKFYSVGDLGYFSHARRLQKMPSQFVSSIMRSVSFSTFAQIQDDPIRMRRGYRKSMAVMAFANTSVLVGLILIAEPLFLILFTEKWLPGVPYFKLLCVSGILFPISSVNMNILKVVGRSDLVLRLSMINASLKVSLIAVVIVSGGDVLTLIYTAILTSIFSYIMTASHSSRFMAYGLLDQIRDLMPYIFVPVLNAITSYFIASLAPDIALLKILSMFIIFVPLQLILGHLLKLEGLTLIIEILKEQWAKRQKRNSAARPLK